MSFVKNKYCLVRKTVSKELSQFVYEYFKLKRDAYDALRKYNFISPFETIVGSYESANDQMLLWKHYYLDVYHK